MAKRPRLLSQRNRMAANQAMNQLFQRLKERKDGRLQADDLEPKASGSMADTSKEPNDGGQK